MEVLGGGTEVEEVGDRVEDGDGLDGAGVSFDGVGGVGFAGVAARGEEE